MFEFVNSYARLPDRFYARLGPTKVSAPRLIRVNGPLASELGIDLHWLASREGLETLAGNHVPASAEPLAMVYAGHQFGHWVPQLGDGRAILGRFRPNVRERCWPVSTMAAANRE
jgi:uncharacterized protein YdiU (UPF0061 family)